MPAATIGALRIDLGIETAQFTNGLTQAERRVALAGQNFKRNAKEMESAGYQFGHAIGSMTANVASFAAGIGIAGFAAMGKTILNFADDLGTAADQAGIGVERYQTLREALRSLEIDTASADKVFKTLQDTLGKVQSGVDDGATKALDRLGISAKIMSGEITSSDQLLDALAESSKTAGSAAQFTSDIVDVFGKRVGVDLAAALRDGGAALHDAEAAFRATGSVITTEMIDKLAAANESIDQFKARATNNIVIWAANAISSFEGVGRWLDNLSAKFARLRGDTANAAMFQGRVDDADRRNATGGSVRDQQWKVAQARANLEKQLYARNTKGHGNVGVQDAVKRLRAETAELNRQTGFLRANTVAKVDNAVAEARPIFGKSAKPEKEPKAKTEKTPKAAKEEVDQLALAIEKANVDIRNFSLMSMEEIVEQANAAEAAMEKARESSGLGGLIAASDAERDRAFDARQAIRDQATDFRETFRETFRDGVQAAMNGDLKGFGKSFFADIAARGMEKGLNSIADFLFGLFSKAGAAGGGGLGGIGKAIGSAFSAVGGLFGLGGPKVPKLAGGGSGLINGLGGIDRNLLSMNGQPVSWVSKGEMLRIDPANDRGRGQIAHIVPSPYFNVVVRDQATQVAAPIGQAAMVGGASLAQQQSRRRATRRLA